MLIILKLFKLKLLLFLPFILGESPTINGNQTRTYLHPVC